MMIMHVLLTPVAQKVDVLIPLYAVMIITFAPLILAIKFQGAFILQRILMIKMLVRMIPAILPGDQTIKQSVAMMTLNVLMTHVTPLPAVFTIK